METSGCEQRSAGVVPLPVGFELEKKNAARADVLLNMFEKGHDGFGLWNRRAARDIRKRKSRRESAIENLRGGLNRIALTPHHAFDAPAKARFEFAPRK